MRRTRVEVGFLLTSVAATAALHVPARRCVLPRMAAAQDRAAAKDRLFAAIHAFDEVRARGTVDVDFGVQGGELDAESRAPRNLADGGFYAVSEEVCTAAQPAALPQPPFPRCLT